MKARWQTEKGAIETINEARAELEAANREVEIAERNADLEQAAELKYGRIPELERRMAEAEMQLSELQAKGGSMLDDKVTEQDVAEVVGKWTGIPVSRLMEGEVEKLIQMETRLHERVIGQDEAVVAVANALRRSRAGLSDPNRPIGSFLFLGPTGVGKTELARALAEFMFDSEGAITRIDMSEYMEKHSVSRLIGAPPGYVGYDEGGQLTEAVRRRPYAVILLDEIEKAHPDAFNVLLQIMDDGRLTDGKGRTVDFTNTVLIMTSNVGSQEIAGERIDEQMREKIDAVLTTTFKPEFLNRIDETVIFHRLSREDITRIVDVQVAMLTERVHERGIEIELTDDARTLLGNLGYDPTYGARPLKRVIQSKLVDRLALKLLEGEFSEGRRGPDRRRRRRAHVRAGALAGSSRRLAFVPVAGRDPVDLPLQPAIELPDLALRGSPRRDHDDRGRGVGAQRVLGRLNDVAVTDAALGREPGSGQRRQGDGEHALAFEAGPVEVAGPAVEEPGAGRGDDEHDRTRPTPTGRHPRSPPPRRPSPGPRSRRSRRRARRPATRLPAARSRSCRRLRRGPPRR